MGIERGVVRKGYFGIPLQRTDDEPIVFYGPYETDMQAREMDDGGCLFYFVVEMEYTITRIVHIVAPEPDDVARDGEESTRGDS